MQTPIPGGDVPHAPAPLPLVGPGYPKVLIGGLPAVRALVDQGVCASPAGPLPNPIAQGSSKVMIGGSPAAYQGSQMSHLGSVITGGYPKVQISV
jgi:uncharacterized Zn-binding protein involved in type VI secretion